MKTVQVDVFNKTSIDHAIAELKDAQKEWQRKANLCAETIAAMLADMISDNFNSVPFGDDLKDIGTHTQIPTFPIIGVGAVGNRVLIQGDEAVFIEFGAGIYHNGSGANNPLSEKVQFDTGIGSFGKGHGNEKYWFVAHNIISCGTPAYMPIHNAIEAIKPMIPTIVRQVFV